MIIGSPEVESIQRLAITGGLDRLDSLSNIGFSLSAALELSCFAVAWDRLGNDDLIRFIERWSSTNSLLNSVRVALAHQGIWSVPQADMFLAPRYEVFPIPLAHEWESNEWHEFLDRFRRSLVNGKFGASLSRALVHAFAEMADNVPQHSGRDRQNPACGVAAYHVEDSYMTFSIADVGRGVLASLHTKPTLSDIASDSDALRTAILGYASCRPNRVKGDGFKTVLDSLSDINGNLRFRSGNACLTISGVGDTRERVMRSVPDLLGFQLSVSCSLVDSPSTKYI
jgi:hypothetical protein